MRLWIVRAGRYGEREAEALASSVLVPGFDDVGDLSTAASREDVRKVLEQSFPTASAGRIKNFANQLWQFVHTIQLGDLVIMPRKNTGLVAIAEMLGQYEFRSDLPAYRHRRSVKWLKTDLQRNVFKQDMLHSFGAFMTICEIERHNALDRVKFALAKGTDPGAGGIGQATGASITDDAEKSDSPAVDAENAAPDIEDLANNQIRQHIGSVFAGHAMARLVESILKAEGYVTMTSLPGKDGGIDILAGRGSLGLDQPRLCVQVKSGNSASDVTVLRALQGSMQNVKADHGLLVSWSGVTSEVEREARNSYFTVRIWDSADLIEALLRNYDRLSEEIRTELPLKRIWTLVLED
jgi:restriction system protein